MLKNIYPRSNSRRQTFLYLSHSLSAIALLTAFSTNAFGQVAIPLSKLLNEDQIGKVNDLKAVDDQLFVSTDEGLWIVSKDGKPVKKAEKIEGYTNDITVLDERVFVSANESVWIVSRDGGHVDKDTDIKEGVTTIAEVDDQLFIGVDEDLFIVNENGKPTYRIKGIKGTIFSIEVYGELVFVRTYDEIFIVSKDGKQVRADETEGKGLYYGTKTVGDRKFVCINEGLWISDKDGRPADEVKGVKGDVYNIEVVDEHLFVGTSKGLWIVSEDGKQADEVGGVTGSVNGIKVIGNQLFVYTGVGLWIVDNNGNASKVDGVSEIVTGIETIGNYIYIKTVKTPYLFDPKVTVKSDLAPNSWWATAIGYVLPSNWLPEGPAHATAYYTFQNGKTPHRMTFPKEFRFAKADGDAVPSESKFSPREQFNYEIVWGDNDVRYWVKDEWGNTFLQKATYRGVPSQYFVVVLLFLLPAIFILGCFALAPRIGFCHSAIMNPWLRKYFSLGSVPLLLSLSPTLRRHILRRYSDSISKEREFAEWRERFVYPDEEFLPENFGKRLENERRLLLTGQSGIGKTSFFKNLTSYYASRSKSSNPAKVFPVYISLINYGGNSLEDLIYNQLFSYGKITDRELAPMFLEQGGLLIFFDGVNEVQNIADRQKLGEFVQRFWTSSYICLSSLQRYPEIENINKVELKVFSPAKICELIRKRINDTEKADRVIKKLTGEDYKLYSVPRDLELAIEILNSGEEKLPKSRTELYKTTFNPIFAKWRESGSIDAENYLCKHAYTMIVRRDLAFDSVDDPYFQEVTSDLVEQKILVRRQKGYNFRHDLIRSYLASEYFYPRWKNLFEEITGKPIDSNWLEMLKFSCENIRDSVEVKSLVYEVLEKSIRKDLVKSLFEWLKSNYPSKCKSWEKEFYAKYGEFDFK